MLYFIIVLSTIVIFQASIITESAITISNSSYNFTVMKEALIHILRFCDSQYDTIIVYDNYDDSIVESLSSSRPLTLITLYKDLAITEQSIQHTKKIDAVIICKESHEQLTMIINTFNSTPWWDVTTPYFIIEKLNNSNDVELTFEFLLEKDILVTYYITLSDNGIVTIITMNPFTYYAPSSWNLMTIIKNSSTLYIRLFNERNICHHFYFDRTKFLNGYKVQILSPQFIKNDNCSKQCSYSDKDIDEIIPSTFKLNIEGYKISLNITMEIRIIVTDYNRLNVELLFQRLYETTKIQLLLFGYTNANRFFDYTFIHQIINFNFLVHHRGYKNTLEKIQDYYGIWTLCSMIFLLSITSIVIWFNEKSRDWAFVGFEILRFLINTAIYTKMSSSALKIFFSMIFLYFLIIHATFSGHLVEFLTKPELRKNAETLEDLKDSQYKSIYAVSKAVYYLSDPELINKSLVILPSRFPECFEMIIHNKSMACISDDNYIALYKTMIEYEKKTTTLYKPLKSFGSSYNTWLVRKQWSLRSRINSVALWMFETGLHDIDEIRNQIKIISAIKRCDSARKSGNFNAINLEILVPAFILLGIGLLGSLICFIMEILYVKFKSGR